jgi:hypothetical protein
MNWASILAYVTGTVDQELLLRKEYLAAENRILKAKLKGRVSGRRASQARRDWSSTGPQDPRRRGNRGPAGHYSGMVPQAGCPQIRWLEGASNPRQTPGRPSS